MKTKKRNTQKKGKDKKKSVPVSPALYHGIFIPSMIYFDSDMSKSTNTVVYFDWKTVLKLPTHSGFHDLFLNSNMTSFFRFADKRAIDRWYNLIRTCAGECD
jgi:hypothetical protein